FRSGRGHIESFTDGVDLTVDGGQPGRFGGAVADVEVLGEQPPDLDDAAEEEDQKGNEEGELNDTRARIGRKTSLLSCLAPPHPPFPLEPLRYLSRLALHLADRRCDLPRASRGSGSGVESGLRIRNRSWVPCGGPRRP